MQAIRRILFSLCIAACIAGNVPRSQASGDAPQWMHALVNSPLPTYDDKTDAVLLYSETNVTVVSADKIRTQVREAYKILRPNGRSHGVLGVDFGPQKKVKSIHGWCIPAQGKDYEVKDKDAIELAPDTQGGELISDTKYKVLHIPASDPGNIVGYEFEIEEHPLFLQDIWSFQETDPVRQSRYTLQLPPGWEYKVSWLNHPEVKPTDAGNNSWQWMVTDLKGIRKEPFMPPMRGVEGQMIVSFFTSGGPSLNANIDWAMLGKWYSNLVGERVDASPEIKQQVAKLSASKTTQLQKMQAIGDFVQHDIRYVAIELGIGGLQPRSAPDVFSHHYGDCKDKATLVRSMLREIGVESFPIIINDRRGSVTRDMPAHNGFNHMITAIRLPEGLTDSSLIAVTQYPKLGRLLFFDPTNYLIPFGQLPGYLQANYGLLVTPEGGELVELPQQPSAMNSIQRTGRLTLAPDGTLRGEVKELRLGERASSERWRLRAVTTDIDRIKPIEELLSGSLANFRITHAALLNLEKTDQPFGFNYSFESPNYAKNAGDLLLVRPRVIGNKSLGFLETKEPRTFAIELEEPTLDTDTFEITIPSGYAVDDVPPPVDVDYAFASYHSKIEVKGNVVGYTRTFEVKELSVPVNQAEQLKMFYRIIASD
ncbi:MAG TPA: DUF3857 and transglutaminase domain-containing protein, partial [Candidatus Sulfotelmatobacter sp.]|nr:DUF3857 and transglutaminase domain-containing protein [Candidatus Sulfotelmatobacter sp.]